ncbi:unnamed protein product [Spirodela intermedia]|uniref:Major facilitator superfamily (MFS) profile domain-containing protein n=1 Tax=Spirodela intermedia TaxID=51605 RepID=A0A7I8IX04_SPIIN|nr:unnamed protein product [Spirodela intermedia]CAA6662125.1 unnamed protein product [Spirodela intermedia]
MAVDGDVEGSTSSLTAEPLLRPKSTGKRSVGMALFSTAVGYSAPTQAAIREELGLSLSEFSLFGSILTIGAMIGAITSGRIADFIGRKGAMRLSAVICFVGWLSIYIAKGSWLLDFGRISTGYGIGILSYVVPIFIAEIAPTDLRGGLTTINQLMICTGVSVNYIVGTIVTWRTLVSHSMHISSFGLCVVPESPRWLYKILLRQRLGIGKSLKLLYKRLRGEDVDVSKEALEIKVGVGLMIFQQLGGINGIIFYASQTLWKQVCECFHSGSLGTIIIASIQVIPITAVGAFLMDKSGRRSLLMVSATGTFVGMLLTAISFYVKEHGWYIDWSPYLSLMVLCSFSIGMGAVPWVIIYFPINVKGIGGSLVTLVNWLGTWLISYSFNFLMALNALGTLFLFSACCGLTILFIAIFVRKQMAGH